MSLVLVAPAMAEDEKGLMDVKLAKDPEPLAKNVEAGIDHLFDVMKDSSAKIDPAAIQDMLNFVANETADPKDISPARRFNGNGICLRQNVKADLDTILRYFYNPDIPNYLLCPAVLRLSGWYKDSEFLKQERPLWEQLKTLDAPVQVRGKEFESCTPDSFGEAYFRYDLNRLISMMKYQGKNVLVSVSLQDEKSDVGRKGAILNDKEWEYFYSGIEGINRSMIGWADSFMYESASVMVLVEQDGGTTLFLFKWLKAGWAGMNLVKRKHIYDGTLRYVRSLKAILDNPDLTPEDLMAGMKTVAAITPAEEDALIEEYAKNFEIRFKDDPKLKKREYAKVIADGGYAKVLDADARKSILSLQKLKAMMGMDTLINLSGSPVAQVPEEQVTPEVEPES
ncbi:hypothetical protein HFN16_03985 [Pseudodesulfovibrio sp. zrk46]|nr:hypothetical protein HFN16_03985 [Pseudodesulfovibrio sp. zrk46]